MEGPIRIVLVDDHGVVRQGLKAFLATEEDIEVVGEASNGREAVEIVGRLEPDVVLMDLVMPELDGIGATTAIKQQWPQVDVIAMTSFIEDEKVFGAMRAGAGGYVLKDADPDDVVKAIRSAAAGEVHLDPRVARRLMEELSPHKHKETSPQEQLSEREVEVLKLVAKGHSNQMIAEQLIISPKTAKTHVSNILSKLGLASRTQAAVYALKAGLVSPEEASFK
ncbi:MAG TPA: response regulator transcription factor [Chloroflexia bacterium]|jgi:NarL family two-component system response regulator LiaR|nr:response regulator transcription factor [Chloroflexia bacterium]